MPADELKIHADRLVQMLGTDPIYRDYIGVLISNEMWRETLAQVPFEKRLLLLPKCLRVEAKCPAPFDEFGLLCKQCGLCTIQDLQADTTIPKEATNLVYMAVADSKRYIDSNIIYSIFKKRPKRADIYWFLHVDTVDSPFTSKYSVDTIIPKKCFFVRIKLGFKADHRVNLLFNKILHEMADNAEIDLVSHYDSLRKHSMPADFKYIILHSLASVDSEVSSFQNLVMQGYSFIKEHSLPTEEQYGLELANVAVENVPIMVGPAAKIRVRREKDKAGKEDTLTTQLEEQGSN